MTRLVPVTVLVMLMTAGVANAQGTGDTLPQGATIVFEHRQILGADKKFFEPQSNTDELLHYFNLAHCNCAKANVGKPNTVGTFNYLVRETAQSGLHFGVDFWAGTDCNDLAHRTGGNSPTCVQVDSVSDLDTDLFTNGGSYRNFNLFQAVNSNVPQDQECQQLDNVGTSIFALVDTTGGKNYDYSKPQPVGTLSGETAGASGVDTKPPPLPSSLSAHPNEEGIDITWKAPTSNSTDIALYQALCLPADGTAPPPQEDDPQYVTTQATCPGVDVPAIEVPTATPLANGELVVTAPAGAFGALDSKYICGHTENGTVTSLSIDHLNNGTPYQVIFLAIDHHGNFKATYFDHTVTPQPVTDFWEDLHDRGSKAEGGLCLLAETYGDDSGLTNTLRAFRDDALGASRAGRWLSAAYYATLGKLGIYVHGSLPLRITAGVLLAPIVAFALLWYWLTLPGVLGLVLAAWLWRRHRALLVRAGRRLWQLRGARWATTLAIVVLGAGRAHAGGYEPYWEDQAATENENQAAADEASLVKWHAGIRVGPYLPSIDKQSGLTPGSFEQAFGGSRLLPMLDVDRFLWTGFGQVGVGVSVGYLQKTGRTFVAGSDPNAPDRPRARAKNKFALLPLAITATYRFTWLDDTYGIPLVPYVRGGLSYYTWWVTAPNGDFATACIDGGTEPTCKETTAFGASLGVQGSVGLAIRAERIDAAAARSMRASGIEHAGIYGELSTAKVDGFGSDKKLSVGDTTWFAGVDFEF